MIAKVYEEKRFLTDNELETLKDSFTNESLALSTDPEKFELETGAKVDLMVLEKDELTNDSRGSELDLKGQPYEVNPKKKGGLRRNGS